MWSKCVVVMIDDKVGMVGVGKVKVGVGKVKVGVCKVGLVR